MTLSVSDPIAGKDRRLFARLRRAMLATVTLAALAICGLFGAAAHLAALQAAALDRVAAAQLREGAAARLAAEASALATAPSPAHAMVARGRLLAARDALETALGPARGVSAAAALDLAQVLGMEPPGREVATAAVRLRRLVQRDVVPGLAAARAAAERDARDRLRRWRGLAGMVAVAGIAAVWLGWQMGLAPAFRRLELRAEGLRRVARRIGQRMLHDGLTGLSNRRHLIEQLSVGDPEGELALLHLDIANFRALNAGFGREYGDRVLCHVADTLSDLVSAGESVARLDADAFVIATQRRTHPSQLQELAVEIMQALERRATIAGHDLSLSAIIGIASRGSAADTIENLMVNAEIACARARKEGGSVYFSEEMGARLTARRQTAQELLQALMRDEIEPFFQPQIEVATGRIVGFEALARWRQPDGSVLSPYFFMDIAQDARLSHRITTSMLSKALPALAGWRAAGLAVPQIGLNVTLRELRDPDFHDRLILDLDRLGLAAPDLCIEILESALIETDDDPALGGVARLSQSGFRIDLDDFGTGHASLSNLQRLAVDRIKIDRAFIRDLPAKPDVRKVTVAMIHLARNLGITALAEGVETDDERQLMAELGVQQMQGFALGRPMAAERVPDWLRRHAVRAVSAA